MIDVAVVDYGVGNLLSVSRALSHCGARVAVTADSTVILKAPRVILPGVGAFASGMSALRERGLDRVVAQVAEAGTPLLGICLGMQMLMDTSEEFGETLGLGLIPGRVVQIPSQTMNGESQKIPHIGWSGLWPVQPQTSWAHGLLQGIEPGDAVYFVHSYMAQPQLIEHRLADCLYGGVHVSAVVQCAHVAGCQFHPEKSGEVGLRLLRNFLRS